MKDTVLIVDDAPENMKMLRHFLEDNQFDVIIASRSEEALRLAERNRPDLILLDIILPGIDGFEICRLLKSNFNTQDIPVIFMTALVDIQNKVRGFKLGGADYITKPIQYEEVLARVNAHIDVRRLQRRLQSEITVSKRLRFELEKKTKELERLNDELQRLSTLDALTEVANRRRLDDFIAQEWRRALREKTPLSIAMCDIDHFKRYNDAYGHMAGDECLRQVAQGIERAVKRATDLVARYGGEEFMIVFPNTDEEGALGVAENIRAAIESLRIIHEDSYISRSVTVSIGIATWYPTQEATSDDVVRIADEALYEAKAQGRNRVVAKSMTPE